MKRSGGGRGRRPRITPSEKLPDAARPRRLFFFFFFPPLRLLLPPLHGPQGQVLEDVVGSVEDGPRRARGGERGGQARVERADPLSGDDRAERRGERGGPRRGGRCKGRRRSCSSSSTSTGRRRSRCCCQQHSGPQNIEREADRRRGRARHGPRGKALGGAEFFFRVGVGVVKEGRGGRRGAPVDVVALVMFGVLLGEQGERREAEPFCCCWLPLVAASATTALARHRRRRRPLPPPLGPLLPAPRPPRSQQRRTVGVEREEVERLVRARPEKVDAVAAPEGRDAAEDPGGVGRRRRRTRGGDAREPDPLRRLPYAGPRCPVQDLLQLHPLERRQGGPGDGAGGGPGGEVPEVVERRPAGRGRSRGGGGRAAAGAAAARFLLLLRRPARGGPCCRRRKELYVCCRRRSPPSIGRGGRRDGEGSESER